jgi:hypothetical protein
VRWLLSPAGPPLARVRVRAVAWPLAGLALTKDNVGQHRTGRPRSRRDLGLTALIEGFFAFVWFGWGQANAGPGLRVGLAVAGVAVLAAAGRGDFIPVWVCAVVGVGTLLTGFALAALAGTRAEETAQHSSPDRPV